MSDFKISRRDFIAISSAAFLSSWRKENNRYNRNRKTQDSSVMVKVLGTAQDGGLPQAACFCPHCRKARKDKSSRRLVSSIAIINQKNNKVYLIDATPDIREQLDILYFAGCLKNREKRNPIDVLLLTHGHTGHYSGLVHLGREAAGVKGLKVFCSDEMGDFLEKNGPWSLMIQLENIKVNRFAANQLIKLDDAVSVRPILVPHRAEFTDTMAFEVIGPRKSLLYLPDIDQWEPVDKKIRDIFSRVDYALVDGTFYSADELPGRDISKVPHPLIPHTIERFKDIVHNGTCTIYFTHLNHTNKLLSDENAVAELQEQGFKIAQEEMEIIL